MVVVVKDFVYNFEIQEGLDSVSPDQYGIKKACFYERPYESWGHKDIFEKFSITACHSVVEQHPYDSNLLIVTDAVVPKIERDFVIKSCVEKYSLKSLFCDTGVNGGFLRAICDKSQNVLGYIRVQEISSDLQHSDRKGQGTWFVFEEYNIEKIGGFQIKLLSDFYLTKYNVLNPDVRLHQRTWDYDDKTRTYTFIDDNYAFKVSDHDIRRSRLSHDFRFNTSAYYHYTVKQNEPNQHVVKNIHEVLKTQSVCPKDLSFTLQKKQH